MPMEQTIKDIERAAKDGLTIYASQEAIILKACEVLERLADVIEASVREHEIINEKMRQAIYLARKTARDLPK